MEKNVIKNYTLGSDFELFLYDEEKEGVINAKPYVKGTKEKPYNFDKSNPFWCTSLDNISAEMCIPPCTLVDDWNNSIKRCIDYVNGTLPNGIRTIHDCAVYVDPKQLRTKQARILGCEASMNAYTLMENPRPSGEKTNLRTCCTHVHMKYDDMDIFTSSEWIKAMDLFLGMPSLIIEPENDRRKLYGTLGEMRFSEQKTTEYRVLSSYFSQSDTLRKWVFENTVKAIDWINEGNRVSEDLGKGFHQAMAKGDKGFVMELVQQYNINLPLNNK